MKRRTFIQWVLGILGINSVGSAENENIEKISTPPPKEGDVYQYDRRKICGTRRNKTGTLFFESYEKGKMVNSTIFPDEIIQVIQHKGRLIVACKHSIWELEEDSDFGLRRKMIAVIHG